MRGSVPIIIPTKPFIYIKGYTPIDMPTKPYIKAYVINKLGKQPLLKEDGDSIARKLFDLLEHTTNEYKKRYDGSMYKVAIRVYISTNIFKRKGQNLNETNLKRFNSFIEQEVKQIYCIMMDDLQEKITNFRTNLPEVRRKMNIPSNIWSDESMKKVYYRRNKAIKIHKMVDKKVG